MSFQNTLGALGPSSPWPYAVAAATNLTIGKPVARLAGAGEKALKAADEGQSLMPILPKGNDCPRTSNRRRAWMDRPYLPIATFFLACLVCSAGLSSSILAADPEPLPPANAQASAETALGLGDLEQMALERNPTLFQEATQIGISRAKALQAGLYPNPTIGYQGELIGGKNEAGRSTAGEFQGGFIQQEIVTAGKLRLSRAKYEQEARAAEIQAMAQQLRVVN